MEQPPAERASSLAQAGWIVAVSAILLAGLVAMAWGGSIRGAREVSLYADEPANEPADALPVARQPPLRVLVASMISPQSTLDRYAGFVAWLGARLRRPAVLIQRRNYFEANEALRSGEADLAFVCSGAYTEIERQGRYAEMLVVPVVKGAATYRSYLLVGAANPARRLDDLRGGAVAYVDPISLTGHLWIRHRLRAAGVAEDSFFKRLVYTGSHDRSIEAVALGVVDAAPVDHLVYEAMMAERPDLATRVRVLERSEAFGIPPVVVPRRTPEPLQRELLAVLSGMHLTDEGREVLAGIGIDRFIAPPPDHFATVHKLEQP